MAGSIMHAWLLLLVVMVMTVMDQVRSDMQSVCANMQQTADANRSAPAFSPVFEVNVECELPERNSTIFVRERYNLEEQRATLEVQKKSGTTYYHMYYQSNMVLVVNPDTSACTAGQILNGADQFIMNYRLADGQTVSMFSPSGALHFGNVQQNYLGDSVIRGIPVEKWESCQPIPSINANAKVTWYISRKGNWSLQAQVGDAPIQMVAVGEQSLPDGTTRPFTHTYDFFDFKDSVDPRHFQIPDGVYCPNRQNMDQFVEKPFPKVPGSVFFTGEVNDPYSSSFSYLEEAFDNETKMSAYRFKLDPTVLTDMGQYLQINDYNNGVSYLLDTKTGNCILSSIKHAVMAFSKTVNDQKVRMETPREFFMDKAVTYQYAGSSTYARNIPAERWVGASSNITGYQGTLVNLEWYFAVEDNHSWNDGQGGTTYRIPILFRIVIPGAVDSPGYDFHLFNFNTPKSSDLNDLIDSVDISACFNGVQRASLRFRFPKSNETTLKNNIAQTRITIKKDISLTTGINPLRIADVKLYFYPNDVWVTFDLLERPQQYNDVTAIHVENTLSGALEMLRGAFRDKTMVFYFASGVNLVSLTPYFDSLGNVTNYQQPVSPDTSSSYSTGAFAGVAAAMLLVGGAGGAAGTFFFLK